MYKLILIVLLLGISVDLYALGGFEMINTNRVCANYPHSEQCAKLSEQARDYCKDNVGDPRCTRMHFLQKSFCTKNTDAVFCPEYMDKVGQYCKDEPNNEACLAEKVHAACEGDPNSENCANVKESAKQTFCKENPHSVPCL